MSVSTSAIASANPEDSQNTSAINTENNIDNGSSGVSSDDKNFHAEILITDSKGTEVYEVSKSVTLRQFLKDNNMDLGNFRTSDDEPIQKGYRASSGETVEIFRSEVSAKDNEVKLTAPEIQEETDSLFIGEFEVKQEGKNGKAVKTVLTSKGFAKDKKEQSVITEEKLTILVQPEPKIVLVGTRERPSRSERASRSGTRTSPKAEDFIPKTDENMSVSSETIELLFEQVGKDYVWGAAGPNAFDCSGLVQWVFKKSEGRSLPRTSGAQGGAAKKVALKNIKIGDILWTNGHIGIYVGKGKMIHAARPGRGVVLDNIQWFLNEGAKVGRL